MSLYLNRIKYKGTSPTMASSSGVINNAMYDGLEFYDYDYQPTPPIPIYTPVTEIKMTNPQPAQWNTPYRNVWIDTGIVFLNTQDIWIESSITPYKNFDDTIIGLCYDVMVDMGYRPGSATRYCFRLFTPTNYMWLDATYGNGSSGNRVNNVSISMNTTYKVEVGKLQNGKMKYIINGTTSSNEISISNYDYASLNASNHIFCCITGTGVRYLKIWSDYTKTTLLFDGIAVIDRNGTPCIYDSVSNEFKYFEYKDGYSDAGTVTYIP